MYLVYLIVVISFASGTAQYITINGSPENRTHFCRREMVEIFCENSKGAFTWTVPQLSINLRVSSNKRKDESFQNGIEATYLNDTWSSVKFSAIGLYNATVINCLDTFTGNSLSSLYVEVAGDLDAPVVSIDQRATTTTDLHLIISQTGDFAMCVQYFQVTATVLNSNDNFAMTAFATDPSNTKANLKGLNLCESTYSIDVQGYDGRKFGKPYVETVKLTFEGIDGISNYIVDSGKIWWHVPPEISHCISRFAYYLVAMNISGYVPANATMLPLQLFNTENPCLLQAISIAPVFHVNDNPLWRLGVIGPSMRGISNFKMNENLVTWFTPPEVSHCFTSYEYSFKFSNVVGRLLGTNRSLNLDNFKISTPCQVDMLTISPILIADPVYPLGTSGIVFTGSFTEPVDFTTENSLPDFNCETTSSVQNGSSEGPTQKAANCISLRGGLIAVVCITLIFILILIVFIVHLIIKLKKLKLKLKAKHNRNEDSDGVDFYDQVAEEELSHKKLMGTKDKTTKTLANSDVGDYRKHDTAVEETSNRGSSTVVYESLN